MLCDYFRMQPLQQLPVSFELIRKLVRCGYYMEHMPNREVVLHCIFADQIRLNSVLLCSFNPIFLSDLLATDDSSGEQFWNLESLELHCCEVHFKLDTETLGVRNSEPLKSPKLQEAIIKTQEILDALESFPRVNDILKDQDEAFGALEEFFDRRVFESQKIIRNEKELAFKLRLAREGK